MAFKGIQPGKEITWTNTGTAKLSGDPVVIGKTIGICATDIGAGAMGTVHLMGVFKCPKVSAAVFVQGENIAWDASTASFDDNLLTLAAGDVSNSALAWKAGANGETTCEVHLNARIGTVT